MVQSVNAIDRVDPMAAPAGNSPEARPASGEASLSDAELIRRARGGDRDAFGALAVRHQDAVYATAWAILRSREDAEDAAQESFLRVWRGLVRFDPGRPFRPWILRVVANVALTARSRRRVHAELDESRVPDDRSGGDLPAAAAAANRREMLDAVERITAELSPENAALFHLRYGEDLSIEEISRILDRRPGTLAVALHRIREHFRRALFGPENGGRP